MIYLINLFKKLFNKYYITREEITYWENRLKTDEIADLTIHEQYIP